MKKKLEIYIHIPFCIRKCAYCDFLSFSMGRETQEKYVEALLCEIREAEISAGDASAFVGNDRTSAGDAKWLVTSVFFGGGTPSVLPAEVIAELLQALRERFAFAADAEISLEMNPGTADLQKLLLYRQAGVNRISIGCQSMQDKELRRLGRIHDHAAFTECFRWAREAGFQNINIDLMSALPGQSFADWEKNLRMAAMLGPEHISAYSLIIEEGTLFYRLYEQGKLELPEEEEERRMYAETGRILQEYGYHQYEISNYAKEGYECRHNLGYWTGLDYIGFGLGSSSYINKMRFRNTEQMEEYLSAYKPIQAFAEADDAGLKKHTGLGKAEEKKLAGSYKTAEKNPAESDTAEGQPVKRYADRGKTEACEQELRKAIRKDIEVLSQEDLQSEFMILGLRLTRGVSGAEFAGRFGQSMMAVFGSVIEKYLQLGLLYKIEEKEDFRIALTEKGFSLSNVVMSEMLL